MIRLHVTEQDASHGWPNAIDIIPGEGEGSPRTASQGGPTADLQIWVPDVRSPKFAAEARRQSLAVAESKYAQDDQDFIDAISDRNWK